MIKSLKVNSVDASALNFLLNKVAKYNNIYGSVNQIIVNENEAFYAAADAPIIPVSKTHYSVYSFNVTAEGKVEGMVKVADAQLAGNPSDFINYIKSNFMNIKEDANISIIESGNGKYSAYVDDYPCCEFEKM